MAEWVLAGVQFSFPNGHPTTIPAGMTSTLAVTITPTASGPLLAGSAVLQWRLGGSGPYSGTPLTHQGGNFYLATLPSAPCGSTVEYYIEIESVAGSTYTSPAGAPAAVYQVQAAVTEIHFVDDAETDAGWTVTNDGDLTDGAWDRGVPVDCEPDRGDPPVDGDGSGSAWLTDNSSASNCNSDVDGGTTTLTSPVLDASDPESYISYWRWYSNDFGGNPGEDTMPVELRSGNGAWVQLELATSTNAWVQRTFRVADYVATGPQVQVRFLARDLGGGSVVEAGVDGVRILTVGCPAPGIPGDLNNDGFVDVVDLLALLGDWGPCPEPPAECDADLNGKFGVEVGDLLILLSNWT
jgi:hypothetical protein